MKVVRSFVVFLALFFLLLSDLSAISKRSLVLAANNSSSLTGLTTQEARKLFLGVPIEKAGTRIIPLLNMSDPLTYQVFLQKVAFMSSGAFESQILSVVFRLGGKRPESYSDLQELLNALQQNTEAVTFLWDDQVQTNQGIKSVTVLWQGSQE